MANASFCVNILAMNESRSLLPYVLNLVYLSWLADDR
jgi:hypothetical protein